jgi:Flp pilus assembly protein TadB
MKDDKMFEATRKAVEMPLEFTRSVMEHSKKLRSPTKKVNKIGTVIGICLGIGLLLTGVIQMLIGKPLWALGTFTAGITSIISNFINSRRKKN